MERVYRRLNKLDDKKLIEYCRSDKNIREICNDQRYWLSRIRYRFPRISSKTLEKNRGDRTWSRYYIDLVKSHKKLLWTHNTPLTTLYKMMIGEYDRHIKCCDPTLYRGAQFRYGLDSQYGDVMFIMKPTGWWKRMKGVNFTDGSVIIDKPFIGRWFQGDFLVYEGKNIKVINERLNQEAQKYGYRPHDIRGDGTECMSNPPWDFTWCNSQMHLGQDVDLNLVDTVLVPQWLISDNKLNVPHKKDFLKMIRNELPRFSDGTRNPLNGKFVLYGPTKANKHYSMISDIAYTDIYNGINVPRYSDSSTVRDISVFSGSSTMAVSPIAFDDATKKYMKLIK